MEYGSDDEIVSGCEGVELGEEIDIIDAQDHNNDMLSWEDKYYYGIHGKDHFDATFALMNVIFDTKIQSWLNSEIRDRSDFTFVPSHIFLPDHHPDEDEYREAAKITVMEKIKRYLSANGFDYDNLGAKNHVRVELKSHHT